MENYKSASKKIRMEITGDLFEVQNEFLGHFGGEVDEFIALMSQTFLRWQEFDERLGREDGIAPVSAMVFSAINLHIISLRLFLCGYIVAAGNIQRQVIETVALALVCSCKSLSILESFRQDKYSSNNAIRDALHHQKELNVREEALKALSEGREFYHIYSHPTWGTIASHIRFSDEGRALYVGASFDDGKLAQYRQEIDGRVSLARVFDNFVGGVVANVNEW